MATFGKIGARPLLHRKTAKDYVQDGLIAMWDGIENIGFGVHDGNSATWTDLTGNGYDLTIDGTIASFTLDGLRTHTVPTDYVLHRASFSTKDLPAKPNMEFEFVFRTEHDYSDNFNWMPLLGGGKSVNDSSRCRNVAMVQYLTVYNRHYCGSATSTQALPFNNVSTVLKSGTHYYSSGENRSRPLFDGEIVAGNSPFDTYFIKDHSYHLMVGGLRYMTYTVDCLMKDVSLCCLRCYARDSGYLTMDERLSNYAIDKARFNL